MNPSVAQTNQTTTASSAPSNASRLRTTASSASRIAGKSDSSMLLSNVIPALLPSVEVPVGGPPRPLKSYKRRCLRFKENTVKRLAICTALLLMSTAGSALAATPDWTKAGAVSALKTAPIWSHAPGFGAPIRVTSITAIAPYGKTRRLHKQMRASMWDVTAAISVSGTPQAGSNRFCVVALGPVRTSSPFTVFRIGGWDVGATIGGCAHYDPTPNPTNSGGVFDWGGSLAWKP